MTHLSRMFGLALCGLLIGAIATATSAVAGLRHAEVASATQAGEAPLSPASSSIRPTPATHVTGGTITAMDLATRPATLTIRTRNGRVRTLFLNLKITSVWRAGTRRPFADLHPGLLVHCRYLAKDGRDSIRSVTILGEE